jgi:hypothetical protein
MKRIFAALLLTIISFNAKAQRPDLPGQLLVDFGFNAWTSAPEGLDLKFFPSNTWSFSYMYDLPIGDGGWAFTPGIGLSLENYTFQENNTLISTINPLNDTRIVSVVDLNDEFGNNLNFQRSQLGLNYIDVPLEVRWFARRDNFSRGFRVAFGGRIGYRYSSYTKVKFKDPLGDNRMIKDRQALNFNRFRYGIQLRAGWSGIGIFGFYELSNKWETPPPGGQNTRTLTVGVTIAAF